MKYTQQNMSKMAGLPPVKDDDEFIEIGSNEIAIFGERYPVPSSIYKYDPTPWKEIGGKHSITLESLRNRGEHYKVDEFQLRQIIAKRVDK